MSVEPTPGPTATGIMARLRDETADLHRAAETHPFQSSMVGGRLPARDFVRWLGQMRLVHEALERALAALRTARPELAGVIRDDRFMTARLESDLARMGETGAIRPLPATEAFVARVARLAKDDPLALLGMLYVLEGSKNGNRFIARVLERQAPGVFALGYLDPHGEAQRDEWAEFKREMEAQHFDAATQSRLVAEARATFAAITELAQELHAAA